MTDHKIATREEWIIARKALLKQEKAHTKLKDEITKARQTLPWVKLSKEYIFHTENGQSSLTELFGSHTQLITYHFMFGSGWEAPCKSCSFWADSFSRLGPHLSAQNIAFAAVSSAPIERLMSFKERMGWEFDWVSSHGTDFNFDFDVGFGPDRPDSLPNAYNFGSMENPSIDEMHGTSVFAKDGEGSVHHTYSTYGRGLDATNAAYAYIDLTPTGRNNEPSVGNPMGWLEYRDMYSSTEREP